MKLKYSCLPDGTPICTAGLHVIADEQEFYTINPIGGYGRDEFLCCTECIKKPEFAGLRERMIELGAKELE